MEWRERVFNNHPNRAVITRRWILPNDTITTLSKIPAGNVVEQKVVAEISEYSEERASAYASEIYNVIIQFDQKKLCSRLACGAAKKVRSVTWQKRVQKRYEKDAELALIAAEKAMSEVEKLKRAAKRKPLRWGRMRADKINEMRRVTGVHLSELRWTLEDAVWTLQNRCEMLREVIVWGKGLADGHNNNNEGNGDGEEVDEEEDSGNSNKVYLYLPPPVRRPSRQSI